MPRLFLALFVALMASACLGGSGDEKSSRPAPEGTGTAEAEPTLGPPERVVETPEVTVPVVRWLPLRFTGPEDVTFLSDLFENSEPINDEVIFQIESVLEDPRGWQQANLDFQRVTEVPASLNDGSVDLFVFVSNPGGFPCASAGDEDAVVVLGGRRVPDGSTLHSDSARLRTLADHGQPRSGTLPAHTS
jgi:hypothetical protein